MNFISATLPRAERCQPQLHHLRVFQFFRKDRTEAHHGAARAFLVNAMTELMAPVDVGGLPLVRAPV